MNDALSQLTAAGYADYLTDVEEDGPCVGGKTTEALVLALRTDKRFLEGIGHLLHDEIGGNRWDFRAVRGTFGPGSLQIVISGETWRCYADVDRFSPYDDLVGGVAHLFGEVVPNWFRRKKEKPHA